MANIVPHPFIRCVGVVLCITLVNAELTRQFDDPWMVVVNELPSGKKTIGLSGGKQGVRQHSPIIGNGFLASQE